MAALVSPKAARRSVRSACGRRTATGTAAARNQTHRQRPERETAQRVPVHLAEPAVEERPTERERKRARRRERPEHRQTAPLGGAQLQE